MYLNSVNEPIRGKAGSTHTRDLNDGNSFSGELGTQAATENTGGDISPQFISGVMTQSCLRNYDI